MATDIKGIIEDAARTASEPYFDGATRELDQDFNWNRGKSRLLWDQARDAVRAAFERSV